MHIAQYIEEQRKLNPEPKHWWQRKSPWYFRILMIGAAIFGLFLAIYLPLGYIIAPAEITDQAGAAGIVFVFAFTILGFIMAKVGVIGLIHTFSSAVDISHGEAALYCIIAIFFTIPFWATFDYEMDRGLKLNGESQMLQAKINELEAINAKR